MSRKDINNARRGERVDTRPLLRGTDFDDDVKQARALLSQEKWLFEEFQVLDGKKETRWGLVFAHPERLNILQERGYLTQFDSTHKVNKWRHNMFSFLVRDKYNVWIPAAHCVVDREESEVISRALCTIKGWCSGVYKYPTIFFV